MTTLLIAATDLPDLYGGRPSIILLDGTDAAALALPGLLAWQVTLLDGAMRLHRPDGAAAAATLPVPMPPTQVLALVGPDATAAAALLGWWSTTGPDLPPLIEAGGVKAGGTGAALPALARLAIAALGTQAQTAAGLHRALVAAREDAEESREAMVSLIRHGSGAGTPPNPTQILSLLPSAGGHVVQTMDGWLAAGQSLGVPLEGLSGLALHVAEAQVSPAAMLRVRLYGAESGRIFGAWLVPALALRPGWLPLDLPTAIGPVRESACLDLTAELESGDFLALSLDQQLCAPDCAVAVRTAPGGGGTQRGDAAPQRALALRLWTAPFGQRFVLVQHWDAEAIDLPLAPFGMPPAVPVRLPVSVWETARFATDQAEWVALGSQTPRLLATLAPGRTVTLVLPRVPVHGMDLLQAEVTVGRGDASLLEAALWLQPEEAPAALTLDAPDARWSGWRGPPTCGRPLLLPLALPLHGPRRASVVLVLRHTGESGPLRVEWSDLAGMRGHCPPPRVQASKPLPAPPVAPVRPVAYPFRVAAAKPAAVSALPAPPPGPPSASSAASPASPARTGLARLHEHYATPDGGYRHLDIWLEDVRDGSLVWPRLRFKFALRGDGPAIEFRSRPDWPTMFTTWPGGGEADAYGPFLLLREADFTGDVLRRIPHERDRRMISALVRLLPQVVDQTLREAPAAAADAALWRQEAEGFAAMLPQPVR